MVTMMRTTVSTQPQIIIVACCITLRRSAYGAWGNYSVHGADGKKTTDPTFIGHINPLRYRGYYYDRETRLYYLQSRYYDPAICRFINADTYATTNVGSILSYNMFAYCENNPIQRTEVAGMFWREIEELGKRTVEVAAVIGSVGGAISLVAGAIGFTIGTGGAGASAIPIAVAVANAMLTTALATASIGVLAAASGSAGNEITNSSSGRKRGIEKQNSDVWNSFKRVKNQTYRTSGHGHNKYYYDWDYTHNEIEVYNHSGKHVGVMDPSTGKMIKPAVPGRTLF